LTYIVVNKALSFKPKIYKMKKIVNLIFRAVALAMGIAVIVLSVLKKLDQEAGMLLLGVGLACLAVSLFENKNE